MKLIFYLLFDTIIMCYRNRKNKDETEEGANKSNIFFGPPTSCEELNNLGYTLNGYYLIKGKGKLNANRIQVVYCQFLQPPGTNKQSNIKFIN